MCVRSIVSHHNFVKCGRIVTKLRYITVIGRSHQICVEHIVVYNSRTIHHRNVKLEPKYFECQDGFLTSWFSCHHVIMKNFWRHDVFLISWQTFRRHEIFFNIMTNVLTSWRLFDVITYAALFDIMANFLTSWCALYVMTYFWRFDQLFVVLTFFYHIGNKILWKRVLMSLTSQHIFIHDNFWLHDVVMNFSK